MGFMKLEHTEKNKMGRRENRASETRGTIASD